MQREITFELSRDLVRLFTRTFIFRYVGPSLIVLGVIMLVVLGALLTGKLSGTAWILLAPPLLFGCVWFDYYKRALNVPDQMPDRNVKVRFDLESITFESIDHTSTMKWSRIKKLWVSPDVLLLFTYDNQTFSLLPVAPLGEDGKRFIEAKVREHGGQVS